MESTNLFLIFLTGLTTGGLTCLALQGGLLASVLTKQDTDLINTSSKKSIKESLNADKITDRNFLPIIAFLSSKLVAHTLLGAILGIIGASLTLSPITRGWLQIFIGFYLFGVAGSLLDLHPIFRYFIIKPPKFLMRLVKDESKSKSVFAPAILGALTVFIPCATTQAMEIVAIGTGNPLYAAAIMFAFVLGTSPTFLIFGFLMNKSANWFKRYFPAVASTAMFIMAIYSINSGAGAMGSVYTIQNFLEVAKSGSTTPANGSVAILGDNTQTATITAYDSGYSPRVITLKRGIPAVIKVVTNRVSSCARAFTIPSLNIQKLLPSTGETIVEFTPQTTGPLAFSCSMGMYTGRFNIIN